MSDVSNCETEPTEREEEDTKLESVLDATDPRSAGTPFSSFNYTIQDYYDLTVPLIEGRTLQSLNAHSFLRTLADFLLTHSFQLKALQKREIKLSDLSIQLFDEKIEGLVIKSILPKTTQVQFAGCVRHKVVELCPIFILSMYLFARCHIPNTYDEYDLDLSSFSDSQFLEYKLLNGGNKLRPLSYSQQYKASTKVLKIMDEFKPVHLGKILTTQRNTNPHLGCISELETSAKPLANSNDRLPVDTICRYAGFRNEAEYLLQRAQLDPPQSVVREIFPFLNNHDSAVSSENTSVYQVFDFLRRTLVQDMVEIKQRFRENLLCEHPIFTSQAFCDFAQVPVKKDDKVSISEESQFEMDNYEIAEPSMRQTNREGVKRTVIGSLDEFEVERNKIRNLEKTVFEMQRQQREMTLELKQFIESHNLQMSEQSKTLTKLINSNDGLSILLTTRNSNAATYAKQVLSQNASRLESLHQKTLHGKPDLLSRVNISDISKFNGTKQTTSTIWAQNAIERLPSKKVNDLWELWNDYRQWMLSLREANISLETWINAHSKEDFVLFNERRSIVDFLEMEAARRQISVADWIEKVQQSIVGQYSGTSVDEFAKKLISGELSID